MRGTADFGDLPAHRPLIDALISRKDAHHASRIETERPALQRLPGERAADYEESLVTVT